MFLYHKKCDGITLPETKVFEWAMLLCLLVACIVMLNKHQASQLGLSGSSIRIYCEYKSRFLPLSNSF